MDRNNPAVDSLFRAVALLLHKADPERFTNEFAGEVWMNNWISHLEDGVVPYSRYREAPEERAEIIERLESLEARMIKIQVMLELFLMEDELPDEEGDQLPSAEA